LQAEELAELEMGGSKAYSAGRFAEAAQLFTNAINKTSNNPDHGLYMKREKLLKLQFCNLKA